MGRPVCRIACAPLFLSAALLFFARSFPNYFVCDDYEFLGRITFHNAGEYFLKSWGYGNEYRPLLVFTYALNSALSGFDPAGYHVFNTLVHASNAIVLALILDLLGFKPVKALLAATIFVLNPVTHQSVLWIAGRPVILSTLFVLLSLWFFLRAVSQPDPPMTEWIVTYASFTLGLLTYEGAVMLPFLATLLCCTRPVAAARCWRQIAILFCILLLYLVLWSALFGFRISRFPVEHSALTAATSLRNAVRNCFHGSGRPWLAPVYMALLWFAARAPGGTSVVLLASGWFLIAYAPFLLVHGYADRFSYLASSATASVMAFSLVAIHRRWAWIGPSAAAAWILFFAAGMQHRITSWRQAGEIARSIVREIREARPSVPQDATFVLLAAPPTYKQALVFLTGLDRALALQYPHTRIHVLLHTKADTPAPVFTFAFDGGHMHEITPVLRRQKDGHPLSMLD